MSRFEKALEELQRELPEEGLSAAKGKFRIAPSRVRGTWLVLSGVATSTAAIAAILLATPSKSSANRLEEIRHAIQQVRIRHTTTYRVGAPEDGQIMSEMWTYGQKARLEMGKGTPWETWSVFDGKRRWTFVPQRKQVIVSNDNLWDYSADTLPSLADAIRKNSTNEKVRMEETTRNGRPVLQLTMDSYFTTSDPKQGTKRYPLRMVWIAGAEDKLPRETLHFQAVHSDDGREIRMRQNARSKIEYPEELPKGVFDTTVPSGWRVVPLKQTPGKSQTP